MRLRIGFVGVGRMGQRARLRNYALLPDCQAAAIAELREKTVQAVPRRYGVPRVQRDHHEMPDHKPLEAAETTEDPQATGGYVQLRRGHGPEGI